MRKSVSDLFGGRKDGSAVQRTNYSCKRHKFGSQHWPLTPAPGHPMLLASVGTALRVYPHTDKHIFNNESLKKIKWAGKMAQEVKALVKS